MYLDTRKVAARIERHLAGLMKKRQPSTRELMQGVYISAVSPLLNVRFAYTYFSPPSEGLDWVWSHELMVLIQCPEVSAWLESHHPGTDLARLYLAQMSFPIMQTNDRVLEDMPGKVLEKKVRDEVHPLIEAAVGAADGALSGPRQAQSLKELATFLQDASHSWEVEFHSRIALTELIHGPRQRDSQSCQR